MQKWQVSLDVYRGRPMVLLPILCPSFFLMWKEPQMPTVLSDWRMKMPLNNWGNLERLAFIFLNCFKLSVGESFTGCGQLLWSSGVIIELVLLFQGYFFIKNYLSRSSNCYFFVFVFVLLFRATPSAYGGSQPRGWIGAMAASLHNSHSNARSLTHWGRPGIKSAASWFLVRFVSAAPRRELLNLQSV